MNRTGLLLLDLLLVIAASLAAYYLRFADAPDPVEWARFLKTLPFFVSFVLLYLLLVNEYRDSMARHAAHRIGTVIEAATLASLLTVAAYLISDDREFSRLLVIGQWFLVALVLALGRGLDGCRLAPTRNGVLIYQGGPPPADDKHAHRLAVTTRNLWEEIGRLKADYVVIPARIVRDQGYGLLEQIERYVAIPVFIQPEETDMVFISGQPVMYDRRIFFQAAHQVYVFRNIIKRSIDIALATGLLLLLLPLLLVIYGVIRLGRYGTPVFTQTRIGRYGQTFTMYKFRTMRADASGPLLTAVNDPRITPIGHLLRRFSLDELPQLVNILFGDMSFVGPRPDIPELVATLSDWQRKILSVRPGLTGLVQVSGRDDLGAREKLILDIYYAHHYNFWLDAWIGLRTFSVVVRGTGVRS